MNKPLLNKNIVITRSAVQSDSSIKLFEELGASVLQFPTISIIDPSSFELFDNAVTNLANFDYLIFTSANAVKSFSKRITDLSISPDLTKIKVIVTGSKTSESCREEKIKTDIIPPEYSARSIIESVKNDINGKKVFIPCSAIARDELSEGLSEAGAEVTKVPVYDVGLPEVNDVENKIVKLNQNKHDVFIFTSPSTFENFLTIMKIDKPEDYFEGSIIAAIGTTTETAINKHGLITDIVPKVFTMEALADAIVKYFEKDKLIIERK